MNYLKSDMATKQQIRNYYADQGYISRVTNDGCVTFKRGDGRWQDGLWQENYLIQPDGTIRIN